jgi:putative PEP-CTERM system histidine kinase
MMDYAGLVGFALATTAYLVFSLLLFAARNSSVFAKWLLVTTGITILANLAATMQVEFGYSLQWVLLADGVKIACWSVLILLCNAQLSSIKLILRNYYIRQYLSVWATLMLASWCASYLLNYSYEYLFLLFIILNLWALVLVEQLFRSANSQVRWAIWPLVIAVATVALFDFVMYAQATMVGAIDFKFWYSRGFIAMAVVPLLLISTRRIRNGDVRIFVSRNVVFYSSMLIIAGAYLLVMALAGYVLNYLGGEWGNMLSIGFLLLASIVLVVLLITESLRKRVKVFIAKNFFANKYEYRDEWLNLIELIETTSAQNYYQMATKIMTSKIGADHGAIVKRVTSKQCKVQFSSGFSIDEQMKHQLVDVSRYTEKKRWIIDIAEYEKAPSIYDGLQIDLAVFKQNNIRIIVPIHIGKAFYGLFIFTDSKKIKALNWEDRDLLFAIAKQLANFISLHEANDKLAESKQFDAFNRMSAFLVHDLKNIQAQLSLISSNAEKHRDNPAFIDDVFETVDSATSRLDKVLSQLRNKQVEAKASKSVDLGDLISRVVEQRNVIKPKVDFDMISNCVLSLNDETFFSVMNHLIQNAQEATKTDGWVKVTLQSTELDAIIKIEDNGLGMSKDFIDKRLFKAFDTTKGNAGMGIGVYEAKQFIESRAGIIHVISEEGKGTTFTIEIPINPVY